MKITSGEISSDKRFQGTCEGVQAGVSDLRGEFRTLAHRVFPIQFEQFVQPLGVLSRLPVRLQLSVAESCSRQKRQKDKKDNRSPRRFVRPGATSIPTGFGLRLSFCRFVSKAFTYRQFQ